MSTAMSISSRASCAKLHVAAFSRAGVQKQQVRPELACFAEAETSTAPATTLTEAPPAEATPSTEPQAAPAGADNSWVSVIPPEELPKGVRKEVNVDGNSILLFWYRNQIYAISSRSPAEGAYSEGFIKAKFTQDYGIICPSTGSVFSLKDGSILEWYPTNPVLRSITPQTGSLTIYPVKLTQDAIQVSLESTTSRGPSDRGGADTSLENNNVFAVEPKSYVAGSEADASEDAGLSTALTLTVAISAFAIVATAGTATALYYEDFVLLGGFWAFMLGVGAFFTFQQQQSMKNE